MEHKHTIFERENFENWCNYLNLTACITLHGTFSYESPSVAAVVQWKSHALLNDYDGFLFLKASEHIGVCKAFVHNRHQHKLSNEFTHIFSVCDSEWSVIRTHNLHKIRSKHTFTHIFAFCYTLFRLNCSMSQLDWCLGFVLLSFKYFVKFTHSHASHRHMWRLIVIWCFRSAQRCSYSLLRITSHSLDGHLDFR